MITPHHPIRGGSEKRRHGHAGAFFLALLLPMCGFAETPWPVPGCGRVYLQSLCADEVVITAGAVEWIETSGVPCTRWLVFPAGSVSISSGFLSGSFILATNETWSVMVDNDGVRCVRQWEPPAELPYLTRWATAGVMFGFVFGCFSLIGTALGRGFNVQAWGRES